MLDVAWMLFISEVFGDLFIGELASKPGVPPEQERHEDDQPGGDEKERAIPRGHFVMRRRGRLLRGSFRGDFRCIAGFGRGRGTCHVFSGSLSFFGRGRRLRGCPFALPQEPPVAKLPENIQEEDPGDAQHNQALEETVHCGERPGDDDPTNPRERNEAEQNGNQEHHRKQWTSSSSFIATVAVVTPRPQPRVFAMLTVEISRASSPDALRMALATIRLASG